MHGSVNYSYTSVDASLTVDKAAEVILLTEKDWDDDLGIALLVPKCVRNRIKTEHDELASQKRALAKYWVETMYNASWSILAGVLYYTQEHSALNKCKEYFTNTPGLKLMHEHRVI